MKSSLSPSQDNLNTWEGDGLAPMIETIRSVTSALQAARAQGIRTYGDLGRSAQEWSNAATKATGRVLAMLSRHNLLETTSVAIHSRAEETKSLATVRALKQLAPVRAVMALAKGFEDLGDFNFWGAAQEFAAAALYGTIAASQVAAAVSGFSGHGGARGARASGPGAGSGRGPGGDVGSSITALAAGAASAASPPSGHLTVAIMGHEAAGEWLAQTLNTAVEQRGVQLTSSRSTRSSYAQG